MAASLIPRIKSLFLSPDSFEKRLNNLLGFWPGRPFLYQQAFRHRSTVSDCSDKESNERLEFLGDSVIELIVREYLYYRFPDKNEGELTEMRVKIVNREFLNELGDKLELKDFLEVEHQNKGRLIHESSSIQGNAVEALIGAIFLDKGYNAARRFFVFKALKEFSNIDHLVQQTRDFKSIVVQWAQKENSELEFQLLNGEGMNGSEAFKVGLYIDGHLKGKGEARKKKKAENEAARVAYENGEFDSL